MPQRIVTAGYSDRVVQWDVRGLGVALAEISLKALQPVHKMIIRGDDIVIGSTGKASVLRFDL